MAFRVNLNGRTFNVNTIEEGVAAIESALRAYCPSGVYVRSAGRVTRLYSVNFDGSAGHQLPTDIYHLN